MARDLWRRSNAGMKTTKPRKQRKRLFNAPIHQKRKRVTAMLSKELQKSKNKSTIVIRTGDDVEAMRGSNKKRRGEVQFVDYKKGKIFVKNITKKKTDGSEVMVPIAASNVKIVKLKEDDKRRF